MSAVQRGRDPTLCLLLTTSNALDVTELCLKADPAPSAIWESLDYGTKAASSRVQTSFLWV